VSLDLALRPGLVLAVGPNGAGKTNLLESLHVATQGFSPRTRADANLVRHGARGFRVAAAGTGDRGEMEVEVRMEIGQGKDARLNGMPLASLERLRTEAVTLVFTPDRLAVVKAGPAVRRAYLDRALARLFPARAPLSHEYADALAQRNAALRRVAAGLTPRAAVDPWNVRLTAAGEALARARRDVIDALAPAFTERTGELGLLDARLEYVPSPVTVPDLEERFERDADRAATGIGPHRDEIRIIAGGHDLRSHGSQGEQRIALLALLLAEATLVGDRRVTPPLLLLDDVLSELDGDRRESLVARLRGVGQAVVTTASRGALPGEADQLLAVRTGLVETD
jgi:DNA replication and repair protein RecF